jgi:hypothetical protein
MQPFALQLGLVELSLAVPDFNSKLLLGAVVVNVQIDAP